MPTSRSAPIVVLLVTVASLAACGGGDDADAPSGASSGAGGVAGGAAGGKAQSGASGTTAAGQAGKAGSGGTAQGGQAGKGGTAQGGQAGTGGVAGASGGNGGATSAGKGGASGGGTAGSGGKTSAGAGGSTAGQAGAAQGGKAGTAQGGQAGAGQAGAGQAGAGQAGAGQAGAGQAGTAQGGAGQAGAGQAGQGGTTSGGTGGTGGTGALPVCGAFTPSATATVADYADALAAYLCALPSSCCTKPLDASSCKEIVVGANASPNLYASTTVSQCITDLGAQAPSCAPSLPPSCKDALVLTGTGAVAPGGTCQTTSDCAPCGSSTVHCGVSSTSGTTKKTCGVTVTSALDERCDSAGGFTFKCASGLKCESSTKTCKPLRSLNQTCIFDSDCTSDLFCEGSPGAAVCVAGRVDGSICTENAQCASDTCTGGFCAPLAPNPIFCGAPDPSVVAVAKQQAKDVCAKRYAACCQEATLPSGQNRCEVTLEQQYLQIASVTGTYDSAQASLCAAELSAGTQPRCLARSTSAALGLYQNTDVPDVPSACTKVFVTGAVAPGGACERGTDCAYGSSGEVACVNKLCVQLPVGVAGDACSNSLAPPGNQAAVCRARDGLFCDLGTHTCAQRHAQGVACSNGYECASNVCTGSLCAAGTPKANGAACALDAECANAACVDGVCALAWGLEAFIYCAF